MNQKWNQKEITILNTALNRLCQSVVITEKEWMALCGDRDWAIKLRSILIAHGCAQEYHAGLLDMRRGPHADEYRTTHTFRSIWRCRIETQLQNWLPLVLSILSLGVSVIALFT